MSSESRRRRRAAERHEQNYGEHADYVRSLPCVACGWRGSRVEAAHVVPRSRGGGADVLVPLCHGDHMLLDWRPWAFREKYPDLDLMKIASELAKENEVTKKDSKVDALRKMREAQFAEPPKRTVPVASGSLSSIELAEFASEERLIGTAMGEVQKGVTTVGKSLGRIRDKRLYRANFGSFEEYVESRWQISRQHAYRLIDGAKITELLAESGVKILPANERQSRPLMKLPEEEWSEAWNEAVESSDGKPTGKQVEETVKKRGGATRERMCRWKEKKEAEEAERGETDTPKNDTPEVVETSGISLEGEEAARVIEAIQNPRCPHCGGELPRDAA